MSEAKQSQSRIFFEEKDEALKKFRKFINDSLEIPLPILNQAIEFEGESA